MTKTISESFGMAPMPAEPEAPPPTVKAELVPEKVGIEEAKISEVYRDIEIVITQGIGSIKNTLSDAMDYAPRDKNSARRVAAETIRATTDALKLKTDIAHSGIERRTGPKGDGQKVTVNSNVYLDRNTLMEMLEGPQEGDPEGDHK